MYKIIGADQKEYGPVSAEEIRRWVAEGRANGQTLIQTEGQADWRPLSTFPEFAAPAQPAPSVPGADAVRMVSGPATAFLVVGILGAVVAALSLIGILMSETLQRLANFPPQWQQIVEQNSGVGGVIRSVLGLAVSGFIIFASTKLRKLQSYGLVLTAAIISTVPCLSPCCCLPLPLAIWIIIVLCKPEVKSSFH